MTTLAFCKMLLHLTTQLESETLEISHKHAQSHVHAVTVLGTLRCHRTGQPAPTVGGQTNAVCKDNVPVPAVKELQSAEDQLHTKDKDRKKPPGAALNLRLASP